ncbi:unnamed protein product [Calypogeia fissa]
MEVLSARMAPAFKGEDNWGKHKRVYDTKHARQAEVKVEHRPERAVNYDASAMREIGFKRMHHPGGVNAWDGVARQAPAARSMSRTSLDEATMPNGYGRRSEMPVESSDDEPDTSHDVQLDESDNSGDDEPVSPQPTEAPQKWPIIQIVAPPPWLPEGWTAVLRTRESGSKDKYYVDPVSQRRFRSKTEVNYFLQTGKSYRYKRNLALLTKPLKEDPVSLPSTVPLRNVPVDVPTSRESLQALPFMSPSSVYGSDHRGSSAGQARSSLSPDLRLSILPSQAEVPRKSYNKPGPKPKVKPFTDDLGRSPMVSGPKRSAAEDRKLLESSPGQGTENRGKLILKLKRKTAELDDGERNGKKPRPFEVVGATTPVLQGKSRSSTSDEDERHLKNSWAVDHAVESSSRAQVAHSLVPSTHVSRRPITKAPVPSWQFQPHLAALTPRPHYGGNLLVSSNGQGHIVERTPAATLATMESETVKVSGKRESPAEQLQKLGRKLCIQAVNVLCSEHGGSNTLQQINMGLHSSVSLGLNCGFNSSVNSMYNPSFTPVFHTPAPYQQPHQPAKKIRASAAKEKSIIPMHYTLAPISH